MTSRRTRNIKTTNVQGVFEMFWIDLPIDCDSIKRLCARKPSKRQQEETYFKQRGSNLFEMGDNLWAFPCIFPAQL